MTIRNDELDSGRPLRYEPDVVVPPEIAIRCVPGQAAVASFTLIDFRDEPLKIRRIGTSSDALAATIRRTPTAYQPGWHYEIDVSLREGVAISTDRQEAVTLYTSDLERPEISVAVLLRHVSRVRLSSGVLVIYECGKEGESPGSILYLDDTVGGAVTVAKATPSDPCLRCEVEDNGTVRPRVWVRYAKELHKDRQSPLTVSIETVSPVREVLCVQVFTRPQ
jgi:hypothetical protein